MRWGNDGSSAVQWWQLWQFVRRWWLYFNHWSETLPLRHHKLSQMPPMHLSTAIIASTNNNSTTGIITKTTTNLFYHCNQSTFFHQCHHCHNFYPFHNYNHNQHRLKYNHPLMQQPVLIPLPPFTAVIVPQPPQAQVQSPTNTTVSIDSIASIH